MSGGGGESEKPFLSNTLQKKSDCLQDVKFKVALLYCYKHQYASLRISCLNNAIQDRKKISLCRCRVLAFGKTFRKA